MNLIEVSNISKTYGSGETAVQALKGAAFSVPKGEFIAIVGESEPSLFTETISEP